ncbi:hypothetical protein KFE25_002188 [Diacronema lutheri]|uniref:Fe2OG dioxygenase domain-containing protein n=2 Tax=Diacronema lutheri TaxID=2081491 RepID=A0A8J6C9E7_DIALT|nr:hypothetical protein KFE25_002188 [Diacronema lutheri]
MNRLDVDSYWKDRRKRDESLRERDFERGRGCERSRSRERASGRGSRERRSYRSRSRSRSRGRSRSRSCSRSRDRQHCRERSRERAARLQDRADPRRMTDLRRRLGERGRAHDGDAAVADSRARDLRTDRGDEAVVRGARLLETDDDPRRGRKPAPTRKGRNTESFDPASTLGRPDLRVRVGAPHGRYAHPLRHDDLIIVPGFFGDESDWSTYHALIRETRAAHAELAARGQRGEQCDWMAWHEGCHLISRAVSDCPTFQKVLRRMADYFGVEPSAKASRFNWYKDASDWKPLHHDSAAFNPERARTQNLTIGISFGAERELAFLHATSGTRVSLPCPNGSLYAFGRDVNINWKHGVNALPPAEHDGPGRVSIILWGNAKQAIEEAGSPPLVVNNHGPSQHGAPHGGGGGHGGRGAR